jgi:hypothetical protein
MYNPERVILLKRRGNIFVIMPVFLTPHVGATIITNETAKYHYVRKRKTMPPLLGNKGENPMRTRNEVRTQFSYNLWREQATLCICTHKRRNDERI